MVTHFAEGIEVTLVAADVARGISIRKAAAEARIPANSLQRLLNRCA